MKFLCKIFAVELQLFQKKDIFAVPKCLPDWKTQGKAY